MEKENFWIKSANILVRFALLAIIGLFLFNIGRSIWKNHDIEEKIILLKHDISELENQSVALKNRILYYQTETYKELEARKHLFYQKPDEKLVVLIKSDDSNSSQNTTNTNDQIKPNQATDDLPNWQKWINYIFG